MKDQYAGDISDFIKFALLRTLAGDDVRLSVSWHYAPGHDGRNDGKHTEWQREEAWKSLDPHLHAKLGSMQERSVRALEALPIWPQHTKFFRSPMPEARDRHKWAEMQELKTAGVDLVFLDPDNGVQDKASKKHATFKEIESLLRSDVPLAFIQFPSRLKSHAEQLNDLHRMLRQKTGAWKVAILRTTVSVPKYGSSSQPTPRFRWFCLLNPSDVMINRLHEFAGRLNSVGPAKAVISECGTDEAALKRGADEQRDRDQSQREAVNEIDNCDIEQDEDDHLQRAINFLQGIARKGRLVTYSEFSKLAALPYGTRDAKLYDLLTEVSRREFAARRGLLSVLVVGSRTGRPGKGFFDLARKLGLEGSDEEIFQDQMDLVLGKSEAELYTR